MELKVHKLMQDIKRNGKETEDFYEEQAGYISDLNTSLHSHLDIVKAIGDRLKTLECSISKTLV
jgi:hypothetical protein